MKRDLDLIKAILLRLEESDSLRDLAGYSDEQIGYHVKLLEDAGLITHEWIYLPPVSASVVSRTRITWAGHEFLDASRNKSIWDRAKEITLEKTGALTFEVFKTVLIQLAKEAVTGI